LTGGAWWGPSRLGLLVEPGFAQELGTARRVLLTHRAREVDPLHATEVDPERSPRSRRAAEPVEHPRRVLDGLAEFSERWSQVAASIFIAMQL
jgi:hypothetical protein